ncbi:enhanced filamentous growth protein-like [Drosophila madeirensis]|uniref:Enhanced filamentous growth protein-like n=1 Tax=Drosophila madeirensis TaxID=30013 RepID=A0AAU9FC46_DROMD
MKFMVIVFVVLFAMSTAQFGGPFGGIIREFERVEQQQEKVGFGSGLQQQQQQQQSGFGGGQQHQEQQQEQGVILRGPFGGGIEFIQGQQQEQDQNGGGGGQQQQQQENLFDLFG